MKRSMLIFWTMLSLSLSGCDGIVPESDDSADTEETASSSEEIEDQIRLKGVSLLGRTYVDILGQGVDSNILDSDENLFETYANNFGGQEGLGYGDIYNDILTENNKMTGYFMGLNYIAYNAALVCEQKGRAIA